jgi:mannose-6-phosphate isomerase-like protein (cupin superfamily)
VPERVESTQNPTFGRGLLDLPTGRLGEGLGLPQVSAATKGAIVCYPPPTGTSVRNAFNGETFIFTHVDESADDFQCDIFLERGGMLIGTGRQHLHPDADENFTIKYGKLRVMVDSVWHTLDPGESLLVPRGVPHLYRNGHDDETLFTARFSPARQFLRFFLNMSLTTANHPEWYDEKGAPPLALRSLALHAYAGHGYGHGIPVWVQKTLFAVLTPVALLSGYKLVVPPRRRRRNT